MLSTVWRTAPPQVSSLTVSPTWLIDSQFIVNVLMGHREMWTLLLNCYTDFNHHACPYCTVKVWIPVQLFTYTSSSPPPLQEEPVYRLSCCLRCGPLVGPICFPLPRCSLVQSLPQVELTWKVLHWGPILLADWPGEGTLPQGSPTNGDSAAWLIGRGQVASLHFSFFCFKQQPLHCIFFPLLTSFVLPPWERGVGLASPRL